jgi:hypothetical protein
MTPDETARVVAKIQIGDNRTVDRVTLLEWHDTIGHLAFDEAVQAVTMHRRESTEYLQPAHVVRNARRVRDERPLPELPWLDDPAPAPDNMSELTAAYRSDEPHRIAIELGKYNRQIVDAGRHAIPEWPLPEVGLADAG